MTMIQQSKNIAFIFAVFLMLATPRALQAATVTSAASGNWGTATTWANPTANRTGTISTSTSSRTVTGNATALFLSNLNVGCQILNSANAVIGTVASIESETSLTLVANAASTNTNIAWRYRGAGKLDDMVIASGHTVTVENDYACNTVSMSTAAANNVLTMSSGKTLTVTGLISMARPNAGFVCTFNVNDGIVNCGSFTMSATTTTRNDIVNITTGRLNIGGNMTTGTTGCQVNITGAGTLEMGGTTVGAFTLTASASSTVVYDAAGAQTIKSLTYNNLTIGGSGTKTSTGVTVNGLLRVAGTAALGQAITFGASSGIVFANTANRNATDLEWPVTFNGTQGVSLEGVGNITLNNSKTLGSGVNLNILSTSGIRPNNNTLVVGGNFTSAGYIEGNQSTITVSGNFSNASTGSFVGYSGGLSSSTTLNLTGDFSNAGIFTANKTTATISGSFTNTGTFVANTGTFVVLGNISNSGTFSGNTSIFTLSGNFTNTGTFSGDAFNLNIAGGNAQSIDGFTTTGTITHSKTAGEATLTGNMNAGPLLLEAATDAVLSFGTGRVHSFTTLARNSGSLKGGSSTISFTGDASNNVASFTAETSTVKWMSTLSNQNIASFNYYNVEFGGAGTKTIFVFTNVANNFIMDGAVSCTANNLLDVGGKFIITNGATYTIPSYTLTVGDSLIIGNGATFNISTGGFAKTLASVVIQTGGSFLNNNNNFVTIAGHLKNEGTFQPAITYTLTGSNKEISGTITFAGLVVNGSYTNIGNLTLTENPTGAGSLNNGSNGIVNVNFSGNFSFVGFNASANNNTVNYLHAGNQTLNPSNYHHLNLQTSGTKTLTSGTTAITGNLTISNSVSSTAAAGLNIDGNVNLENTSSFNAGAFTHNIAGNISIANGSTFTNSSSSIILDGTNQTFTNANASASVFNNLRLNGDEKTFLSNIIINGEFYISLATKFMYGNSTSLEIAGIISLQSSSSYIKAKACGLANNTLIVSGSSNINGIFFEPGFEHILNLSNNKTSGNAGFNSAIAISGTLSMSATGSSNLIFNNDVTFYGSAFNIVSGAAKIDFSPNITLTIGGACATTGPTITIPNDLFSNSPTVKNLIINRTNGITLGNQIINVTDVLTLTSGTLNTNNNLRLVSAASKTARVPLVTGAITGNVIAERFIPGGSNKRKWRLLSAPVNSGGKTTLAEFIDDIFVTAPAEAAGGFDVNPFGRKASIRFYTESVIGPADSGWVNPTNISNTLTSGKAAEVFVRGSRNLANPYLNWTVPDDVTIDYVGELTTGSISPAITYTNTGNAADGYNLIGNPYASPINFDTTGWTKTNIENKYWAYNPNTSLYGSYNASTGESINGMTKYISSGQGFFIKASSASPSITFTENVKCINSGNNYFRPSNSAGKFPALKITLSNDSSDTDETLIILDPQSTYEGKDESDMQKFYNDALNIFSYGSDNSVLSMNAIPSTTQKDTIRIPVWSYNGSSIATTHHVLGFSRFESIDTDIHVYLIDKFLNTITDIRKNNEYHFMITADANSYGKNRFSIVFDKTTTGTNEVKNNIDFSLYPNPADNDLHIVLNGASSSNNPIHYRIIDLMGKTILNGYSKLENNISNISIMDLPSGYYLIQLESEGIIYSKKFIKK